MENEVWKDIEGASGYQCSSLGNFRKRNKDKRCSEFRILNGSQNSKGYIQIVVKGVKGTQLAHRIVAKTFIENKFNKPVINHIDLNKSNNRADNLEWCTQKENISHSLKLGSYKNINGKCLINKITGECYQSITEAAVKLNYAYSTVERNIRINGHYKTLTKKINK